MSYMWDSGAINIRKSFRGCNGAIRACTLVVALIAFPSVEAAGERVVAERVPMRVHAHRGHICWRRHHFETATVIAAAFLPCFAECELGLSCYRWVHKVHPCICPAAASLRCAGLFCEHSLVPCCQCPIQSAPSNSACLRRGSNPKYSNIEHVACLVTSCNNVMSKCSDRWQRIGNKTPIRINEQNIPARTR